MKKVKFLKEKIIYALVAVIIFNVAFISISFAFTGNAVLTGANVRQNIPVINFNNTGTFEIKGKYEETKTLDILLQAGLNKASNCTYKMYFVYENDSAKYIASDINTISIKGMLYGKEIVNKNLTSNVNNDFELLGDATIASDANMEKTQTLSFTVTYNNENNLDKIYKGHIEIKDMICLNNK